MAALDLTLALDAETAERLRALAGRMETTPEACADQALAEFLETWEGYFAEVDRLREDDDSAARVSEGEFRLLVGQDEDGRE